MSERERGGAERTGSPNDGAWQNELTEEDLPSPAARDDEAHDLKLDPQTRGSPPPPKAPG